MRIYLGTHADRPFRLHQASSDWVSVDFLDEWGGHAILRPSQIECSEQEWSGLLEIAAGTFQDEWAWQDGRIVAASQPHRWMVLSEDGHAYVVTPNTRAEAERECALLRAEEPDAQVVLQ